MAMCPYCHSDKPFMARTCHSCNNLVGIRYQFVAELFRATTMIISWVIFGYFLYWVLS